MKKSVSKTSWLLIAVLVICVTLFAGCGDESSQSSIKDTTTSPEASLDTKAMKMVNKRLNQEAEDYYSDKIDMQSCVVNCNTAATEEKNEYDVEGTISMVDQNGDSWKAEFDGMATVTNDSCQTHDMNFGSPQKEK